MASETIAPMSRSSWAAIGGPKKKSAIAAICHRRDARLSRRISGSPVRRTASRTAAWRRNLASACPSSLVPI